MRSNSQIIAATHAEPFERLAQSFIENQVSVQTRRVYAQTIRAFVEATGKRDVRAITREDIIAWRRGLETAGQAPATIARKVSTVRSLLEWARQGGLLETNPAALVKTPRVPQQSTTNGLEVAEVRRLLRTPDTHSLKGKRDRAILGILLYLGLRREELCKLTLGDLGEERGYRTLLIHGKGGKTRKLPVPVRVMRDIEAYLAATGRDRKDAAAPLFTPVKNNVGRKSLAKPLSTEAVRLLVKKYCRLAGISKRITPHSLRHTFATRALDNHCPLRDLQVTLGHADPKTTVAYDRRREDLDNSAVNYVSY